MQGAQKLRSEAYLWVRRNDEGEVQRRRSTFYEAIKIHLNGFHHQAGTKASRADPNSAGRSSLNRSNPLQIRKPAAFGPVIGMAHTVSHLGSFPANFACPSHFYPP